MKVLCVAAHPDDEVLGAGGTLARHASNGHDVHVCILSDGVASRHEEVDDTLQRRIERRQARARKACERLGVSAPTLHRFPDNAFDSVPLLEIVQKLEREIKEHEPDVVYTPHYGDLNVDHELACRATVTATRPLSDSTVERVLAYETLSSTEWSVPAPGNTFQPQHFVDVHEVIETKLEALAVYEDELRDPPHPRTIDTVRRSAQVWGAKVGLPAAEAFELLREVRRHD